MIYLSVDNSIAQLHPKFTDHCRRWAERLKEIEHMFYYMIKTLMKEGTVLPKDMKNTLLIIIFVSGSGHMALAGIYSYLPLIPFCISSTGRKQLGRSWLFS